MITGRVNTESREWTVVCRWQDRWFFAAPDGRGCAAFRKAAPFFSPKDGEGVPLCVKFGAAVIFALHHNRLTTQCPEGHVKHFRAVPVCDLARYDLSMAYQRG